MESMGEFADTAFNVEALGSFIISNRDWISIIKEIPDHRYRRRFAPVDSGC